MDAAASFALSLGRFWVLHANVPAVLRALVSSELEPLFARLGVPNAADAAAQVCAAHGEDKDTITLDEFLEATSRAGIAKKWD